MVNEKMTNEKEKLPKGFEGNSDTGMHFRSAEPQGPQNNVRFGGRGGGPGALGRAIEKPKDVKKTLKRLLSYFSDSKKLLTLLMIAVIVVTLTSLAAPALQGDAIDGITLRKWGELPRLLLALLCVYIVQVGCTLAQTLLSAHLSKNIVKRLRHDLFKKIENLPIKYTDVHSNGDIMSRMTNDVENISTTVSQSLGSCSKRSSSNNGSRCNGLGTLM